jgi:hypothetical protein
MDQLYLPDQDQHDFQVELLKEFLLNDFFLNLTTFDQTTPEDIFPIEPINQDWRNIVRAKDILLEQQLNINIFKPHVKTHFMKEIESIIPPIESLNPEFEFDFVQDYINSLPMLSLDPFDTDTAIAPKSFIKPDFIQEHANTSSVLPYLESAEPSFESFEVYSNNPKSFVPCMESIYLESAFKNSAASDVCSDITMKYEFTKSAPMSKAILKPHKVISFKSKVTKKAKKEGFEFIEILGKPKNFKCNYQNCQSAFSRRHDLKRHSIIHLKVKPYQCCNCNVTFARKEYLLAHRKYNKSNCV